MFTKAKAIITGGLIAISGLVLVGGAPASADTTPARLAPTHDADAECVSSAAWYLYLSDVPNGVTVEDVAFDQAGAVITSWPDDSTIEVNYSGTALSGHVEFSNGYKAYFSGSGDCTIVVPPPPPPDNNHPCARLEGDIPAGGTTTVSGIVWIKSGSGGDDHGHYSFGYQEAGYVIPDQITVDGKLKDTSHADVCEGETPVPDFDPDCSGFTNTGDVILYVDLGGVAVPLPVGESWPLSPIDSFSVYSDWEMTQLVGIAERPDECPAPVLPDPDVTCEGIVNIGTVPMGVRTIEDGAVEVVEPGNTFIVPEYFDFIFVLDFETAGGLYFENVTQEWLDQDCDTTTTTVAPTTTTVPPTTTPPTTDPGTTTTTVAVTTPPPTDPGPTTTVVPAPPTSAPTPPAPQAPPTGDLPATGSASTGFAIAAFLITLAGAGLFIVSRRRTA